MVESCNRNYIFRIYPNLKQREIINKTFGCSRFVYNYYLDFWNTEYKKGHKVNYKTCCRELTKLNNVFEKRAFYKLFFFVKTKRWLTNFFLYVKIHIIN